MYSLHFYHFDQNPYRNTLCCKKIIKKIIKHQDKTAPMGFALSGVAKQRLYMITAMVQ